MPLQTEDFALRWQETKGIRQSQCEHLAGCTPLGEIISNRTSIVWHTLRTKETVGVCTNCNRYFRENDFDYWVWRKKPSYSWGSSDNGPNPANEKFGVPSSWVYPETDLDKLSDAEINFLFEGVQAYRKAQKALEKHFGSEVWSVR